MNKTEMIQELRALTQAGMSDCKAAVEHCQGDLQKAVDYIKAKGLNIADGRASRTASDGVCAIMVDGDSQDKRAVMVEVNCQTDFVAKSPAFQNFTVECNDVLLDSVLAGTPFDTSVLEAKRLDLVATTKENVVIRRWWAEEAFAPNARVFYYMHPNQKIGVLLTLLAPDIPGAVNDPQFIELGDNLTMQVAAMNPLAVEPQRLPADVLERQDAIFQQQLKDLNKPQAAWAKILEGKTRKWHSEVCLLEQESVWLPKTTVGQCVKNVGTALGGEVKVVNFIRCQVGEGIDNQKDDLAVEVAKLSGIDVTS